jgi:hypothetical protein
MLHADVDDNILGSEQLLQPQETENPGPFGLSASGDYVGRTKLHHSNVPDTHLTFYDWYVEGTAIVYYNEACGEGLQAVVGYDNAHLDWQDNPYFNQKNFGELIVGLGAFTKRIDKWLWQAQVTMNMDTQHRNWNLYTNYDLLLWGRYTTCNPDINLHIGFWMQTGMKIDHIYPIIGFDWVFAEDWKLSLVFPMNISLVYTLNESWNIAVAGRFFDIRRRVGYDQPLSEGLFQYRTSGAEFATNYQFCNWLKLNAHVGYTFWGNFRVSNRENKHPTHFDIDSSWYAGGQLTANF